MNTRRLLVVAAALSALAWPAVAQQTNGFYVQGGFGPQWLEDANTKVTGGQTFEERFNTGWLGVAAVGYGFGNGLRSELELGYRDSGVNSASTGSASGSMNAWDFMVNGLYDVDIGMPVTPYIGAGIGGARIKADNITVPGSGAVGINDNTAKIAYQGIAGVA